MAVLPPDPVYVLRVSEMGPVHSLCFHGAERLFSGTASGSVYLWDLQVCQCVRDETTHFQSAQYANQLKCVAYYSLQTNRSPLHFKAGPHPIQALAHFSDTFYTQDKYSNVKRWSITNSGYVLDRERATNNSSYCRMEAYEDRNLLIVPRNESQVEVLDAQTMEQILLLEPSDEEGQPFGTVMAVKLLEISAEAAFVLGAYESGLVCLWDLSTGKLLHATKLVTATEDSPLTVDYDPVSNRGLIGTTGDQIVVFSIDRRAWQLVNKKTEIAIKNRGLNRIRVRARDQKVFASAGWDGRVRVFSWKSLRPLAVLTQHKRNVLDLVYSPGIVSMWKAPIMATAGEDGSIALWDLYN